MSIEQILKIFPNTNADDWSQHTNGGGWVRTSSQCHPTCYIHADATVRARSPRDGGRCTENVVKQGRMVRRLLPEECMRLMSAPDDFQWPEKINRTAMYRIAGNGQASLMVWRLRQMMELVDPEAQSHISLFCGGGVGDVGWHGRFWEFEPLTLRRK